MSEYYKIGSYTPETDEHEAIIERGSTEQGYVFKDEEAYENDKDKVCYVPELSDEAYTGKDFLDIAGEQDLADELFDQVDWQHPETLWEEWWNYGELDKCQKCKKTFWCYGVDKCPHCGAAYKEGE